jgi:hypothetical protein
MKKIIGYLSFLVVLLIAVPTILVSARCPECVIHNFENPKPDYPDPESIIDLKDDMAANLPNVEVPIVDLGEVDTWPAPERVDVGSETNLAPVPPLYMTSHWTRDQNYNNRVIFRPGDRVYWVIGIQNDTGGDASVTGVWDIDYPDGSSVFYSNPTWTVPTGYSAWQFNGIASSVTGMYTFFAAVDYLDNHSEGTLNYWVTYVCYFPLVQR